MLILGAKLSGRRGLFPVLGKAAATCFVAAARNSPNVHVFGAAARPRDRRIVISGNANRADAGGREPCWVPIIVDCGTVESMVGLGVLGWALNLCKIITGVRGSICLVKGFAPRAG